MIRWQRTRRRRQQLALVISFVCVCVFLLTSHDRYGLASVALHRRQTHVRSGDRLHLQHVELWRSLYGLILNNNPRCEKRPELVVPRQPHIPFDSEHDHVRPDVLWMDDADLSRMKTAHTNFVKDIRSSAPKLAYTRGTRGIVTTASDSALSTLTVSLSMLRRTGSNLPVEVFLDRPSPYLEEYCWKILQPLNANCRFLLDIFIAGEAGIDPHTYQFKIFAIIFSSFEDVLFLDADAWPIHSPDLLFESRPFIDSGLVLWPDFWFSSESPYYFDVAKIENVPALNERPSIESGEIMYNKSKHVESLMLATYYNYYGPEYYYLLHSQGGPGEGDKETYGWAAIALGEELYTIQQGVSSLGRHDSSGDYIGTAMMQFDPVQDFLKNANKPPQKPIQDSFDVAHPSLEPQHTVSSPRPFFIHANHPKFDPYTMFDKDNKDMQHRLRGSTGEWARSWLAREEAVRLFGMDIEQEFWQIIREVTCSKLQGMGLPSDARDRAGLAIIRQRDEHVCEKANEYINYVFRS